VAYSDYLCPWCYNASVRLWRLRDEDPDVEVSWRSYLLRPAPKARDFERFRAYTRSWERPAAEDDAGSFRQWEGAAGPPSWSMPPHLVAKAAARLGPEAFRLVHERLLRAYFGENQDITEDETLRGLWSELGLPAVGFDARNDPELRRRVLREHEEARSMGATGVPAVRLEDQEMVITGALPLPTYRRWVERTRSRHGSAE
jgi:predicted DsbA family dithiol-disulfide isomerase